MTNNETLYFVTLFTDYSRKVKKFSKVSEIYYDNESGYLNIFLANGVCYYYNMKHIREYSVKVYDPEIAEKRRNSRASNNTTAE